MNTEQRIIEILQGLPAEQQEEILAHAEKLRVSAAGLKSPRKSGYGLWADLGIDLSADDIDEARREMWKNFPRDDF